MIEQCDKRNPLIRDGTSRNQRLLEALRPIYFRVDERSLDDLLMVASRYARELQYYNRENRPDGDWQIFIEHDISTIIALIASRDLTEIRLAREQTGDLLEWHTLSVADLGGILSRQFSLIFSLTAELDTWYQRSVKGLRLETELTRLITSQLAGALYTAVGYYKCADDSGFLGPATDVLFPMDDEKILPAEESLDHNFHPIWFLEEVSEDSWDAYRTGIPQDCTPFNPPSTDLLHRLRTGTERLATLVDSVYNGHAQVIHNAPDYLEESISEWPEHEPHMALLLTFLQLFRHAQEHMNTLTGRHLNFYYNEVLRLAKNDSVPDKVHVIFELAKQVNSHLIKTGTLLRAGKDASGKELLYQTDRDIVVNKAAVKELKSVHIDKEDNSRIYAAPVAHSADGQGEEFEEENAKWDTFGISQRNPEGTGFLSPDQRTMKFAQVGFAVAAPILLLNQGTRTIKLQFSASTPPFQGLTKTQLTIECTGEEGWFRIEDVHVFIEDGNKRLRIVLQPDDPPVIPYDAAIHGGGYATNQPLIRVLLTNHPDTTLPYGYEQVQDRIITGLTVNVDVTGVSDLILQNDFGLLDATKPFQPFGPRPSVGSRLYVGSREVFQKQLTSLTLNYDWQDIPESDLGNYYETLDDTITNASFQVAYDLLLDRNWESLLTNERLFNSGNAGTTRTNSAGSSAFDDIDGYEAAVIDEDLQEYTHETERGFLRVSLTAPPMAFGHRIFRDTYTKAIVVYAKDPSSTNEAAIPNEPYTPVVEQLTLNYAATEPINFLQDETSSAEDPLFFHVTPFGPGVVRSDADSPAYLVPQFRYPIDGTPVPSEGELYIGIEHLEPPQNLSLLFQVAEGSVDPELPVQKVYWSYLKENEWVPFTPVQVLSDSTNGLLTSGIMRFDIPGDATDDNTVLSKDLYWLRASVPDNTGAICDMIAIRAQAVQASFRDQGNDPRHLEQDLPAESIAKFQTKDPDIKAVSQPYSSYGGEMEEGDTAYYTRVSERLRHKNRGVAIWDYERLVLEAFPSIYKVKCINHSTYSFTGDDLTIPDSEFAPGFVTIIVIPDLRNRNAVDPLEPRASLGTLTAIRNEIVTRIPPFAAERLQVINPLYEKIQVDFEVTFRAGYDRGFYETRINLDIREFLSPWIAQDGEDIIFGGRIHKSVILNFVEELEYVDYVKDFKMNQFIPATPAEISRMDIDEAIAGSARSVFVSHKNHVIGE